METQDHKKATNQSGHEGHGGVHICHKCGWPFPNPHPSARHRRAHKKVCGTVEGYKLDNSQDKTHLDGSDGEHVSDDDHKTPSGKIVERTISRRSSSGVGSRSSRSARSEDEVFADAITDFVDSSGTEYGGMSRGNSLQNVSENDFFDALSRGNSLQIRTDNEPDDAKHSVEDAIADSISESNTLLEDKQLQVTQALEGETNQVKDGMLPQNHSSSSTNPPVVYSSATKENENTVEQNVTQSLSELDDVTVESRQIVSSKDPSQLGTQCSEVGEEASEDVSILGGASQKLVDSVSADGMVKTTGMQTSRFEDKVEGSHDLDSSGNSHASLHSVQSVEAADGIMHKSNDVVEERDALIEPHENVVSLAVPDVLPLEEHSKIAVEEFDHKGEKFDNEKVPDTISEIERLEHGKACTVEERCSGTSDSAKLGESKYACSLDGVSNNVHAAETMLTQEVEQNKSLVEPKTVEELGQNTLDVQVSNADVSEYRSEEVLDNIKLETWIDEKVGCTEEQETIVSSTIPEGGVDNQAVTNGGADACDSIKADLENFVVHETDSGKVHVGEMAVPSPTWAEPAVDDTAPQVKELVTAHDSNDIGYDAKVKVEDTVLNGNEVRIGEEVNDPVSPEIAPRCGLTVAGSDDKNDDLFELERNDDQGTLDNILGSGNVAVVHSQPDSLLTSPGVSEIQSADDSRGLGESINNDNSDVVKIDDSNLKTSKEVGSSSPNSAAVEDSCSEKSADHGSGVLEGDTITTQHAPVSAVDITDSSSQSDSLEANWGSVSVLSAATSHNFQASPISFEPKSVGEGQDTEGKTSIELHGGLEQREGASEIEALQNQQQQGSAVQTGWSSSVQGANEPLGGKRDDEIIAKVNNWSSSSGKQHTALKTLLGEATARSRAESPNHDEDSALVADEAPATNNGFSGKKENLGSEDPKAEAAKEEMGKEWNSPARYPVNIKTEKRRAKSRPLWAPFFCCSSVNAR